MQYPVLTSLGAKAKKKMAGCCGQVNVLLLLCVPKLNRQIIPGLAFGVLETKG